MNLVLSALAVHFRLDVPGSMVVMLMELFAYSASGTHPMTSGLPCWRHTRPSLGHSPCASTEEMSTRCPAPTC